MEKRQRIWVQWGFEKTLSQNIYVYLYECQVYSS